MLEDYTQLKKFDLEYYYYYSNDILKFLQIMYPNTCICKTTLYFSMHDKTITNFDNKSISDYIMKCPYDIVIFNLTVHYGRTEKGEDLFHANILIFNKNTGIFFKLDPSSYRDKIANALNDKLKKICAYIRKTYKIKCVFKNSLKKQAFQTIAAMYVNKINLRQKNKSIGLWMPNGFCHACVFLFLHYVLFYPKLSNKEIYDKIGKNPEQINNLILNYAMFVTTINKTIHKKYWIFHDIRNFNKKKLKNIRTSARKHAVKSRVKKVYRRSAQKSRVKRAYRRK